MTVMEQQVNIEPRVTIRDIPSSSALEAYINNKIEKIISLNKKILCFEVVIEQVQKHQHKGKLYNARLSVAIPHKEIAINHHVGEDVYIVIRDAFNALKRQLKSSVEKERLEVKAHQMHLYGKISKLFQEKRYGFIEYNGDQYYFSEANLVHEEFDSLQIGLEVQFIENMGNEGLQANRISIGKHHQPEND